MDTDCITLVRHTNTGRPWKEVSLQEVSATREADKHCFSTAVDPMTEPTLSSASQCQKNEPRLEPYTIERRPHHDAIFFLLWLLRRTED